jgi:hypothetical protein
VKDGVEYWRTGNLEGAVRSSCIFASALRYSLLKYSLLTSGALFGLFILSSFFSPLLLLSVCLSPEFGKLMSASGLSSIENYECGSPALIDLYNIIVQTPGALSQLM